jgi:hypothetical protein
MIRRRSRSTATLGLAAAVTLMAASLAEAHRTALGME